MANHGFTMSSAGIWKVANRDSDWSDSERAVCYQAAALAELPDATAKAQFVAHLNTLGIKKVKSEQAANKKVEVEIYAESNTTVKTLTELDMRKAIAEKLFPEIPDGYKQLTGTSGVVLKALYDNTVKPKNSEAPFKLYRLFIGSNIVLYRITNADDSVESIARQAIKVLVDGRKLAEADWKTELP